MFCRCPLVLIVVKGGRLLFEEGYKKYGGAALVELESCEVMRTCVPGLVSSVFFGGQDTKLSQGYLTVC